MVRGAVPRRDSGEFRVSGASIRGDFERMFRLVGMAALKLGGLKFGGWTPKAPELYGVGFFGLIWILTRSGFFPAA